MSQFLVAAVLAFSSAAPATTPAVHEVAGCYAVTIGPWLPATDLGRDARILVPPSHVNLTSRPGIGSGQRHFMVAPALGATAQHDTMYWGVTPDGEVRIVLQGNGIGLVLSLRLHGPKLAGTARTFSLRPGPRYPEQSAPVVLSRLSCFPVAAHAG